MGILPRPASQPALNPSVLWISRRDTCFSARSTSSLGRCIANLPQVLNGLQSSGRFGAVRVLDDFGLRHDAPAREAQLRHQLELLRDADVLMGVHGAGLTNIMYLNSGAAVVEFRDHFWHEGTTDSDD